MYLDLNTILSMQSVLNIWNRSIFFAELDFCYCDIIPVTIIYKEEILTLAHGLRSFSPWSLPT